ncbi:MAG: molybdopterin-dependent oxidoreductase [Polyangia bacterium]
MSNAARTHHTFCRICESLCGLEADVDAGSGRIVGLRPDPRHVATAGFACIKGLKQHRMYDSADRLRHPERRIGDRWQRASWDEALADIGRRVARIRAEHGPDAIAMYVGTAAGFSVLHPIFAQGFMTALGSRSMYSSATQDCANKFAVARELYGFPFTQPFPDVLHTRCLVIVGANPVVGLIVDVRPAAGPPDPSSWSGLPQAAAPTGTRAGHEVAR